MLEDVKVRNTENERPNYYHQCSNLNGTSCLKWILTVCFKEMTENFPFELLDHKVMGKDEQKIII